MLHLLHDDYKGNFQTILKRFQNNLWTTTTLMGWVFVGAQLNLKILAFCFSNYIVWVCICICIHACICIESPPSRGLEIIALGTRSLLLVIHYWVRSTPHDWPAYTFVFVFTHTAVLLLAVNIIELNSSRLPCIHFCFNRTGCQKEYSIQSLFL